MFVRKLPALVVTAGLVASLTACVGAPTLVASCDATGNAALVDAPGTFGADPRAEFPTPLVSPDVEVAVVEPGDGRPVTLADSVELAVSLYDGTTGVVATNGTSEVVGVSFSSFVDSSLPFTEVLTCGSVGSRLVFTGTGDQLLGAGNGETMLVLIVDVLEAFPAQATGADQWVPAGFPSVVFAPNGQPGFTFPDTAAPDDLRIATLKQGSGGTVAEGDEILANLTGIVWNGDQTFASNFASEAPGLLLVQNRDAAGSGLIEGLTTALVGQTVGSRVLVVVPPAYGYEPGTAPESISADDTLVFVVDILAIR